MSQTNAIILRVRAEQTADFERLFRGEELPIWEDFAQQGKLLAGSLTRVEYGSEQERQAKKGVVEYILLAVMKDMAAHTAHDEDARFNTFLAKARKFQPEGPLVWGGDTLIAKNVP